MTLWQYRIFSALLFLMLALFGREVESFFEIFAYLVCAVFCGLFWLAKPIPCYDNLVGKELQKEAQL